MKITIVRNTMHYKQKVQKMNLEFDIQSFIEVNRRWNRVEEGKRFKDATKGWWNRASTMLSWLDNGGQGEFQYGGVATIMLHKWTSSWIEHKEDIMGRWT